MNLLVSVRSAEEAVSALEGGAAVIDIKEPARGPLGRADTHVLREVLNAVAGRRPVSAAMGEWADRGNEVPDAELTYFKWGLAGCKGTSAWRRELAGQLNKPLGPKVVLAAYADWQCAKAPSVEEVLALAVEHPGSVMLIDTYCKDANNPFQKLRPSLLDWLPAAWIEDLCGRARDAKVQIALAGSLGVAEIGALLPARPDWFAVRGAVCNRGDRQGTVQADKVRELVGLIASVSRASATPTDPPLSPRERGRG